MVDVSTSRFIFGLHFVEKNGSDKNKINLKKAALNWLGNY